MNAAAAALLLVAGLAAAGVLLARRRSPAADAPLALRLRQPLGKESGVAIVRWGEEELLLGYGTAGVVRLAAGPVGVESGGRPAHLHAGELQR